MICPWHPCQSRAWNEPRKALETADLAPSIQEKGSGGTNADSKETARFIAEQSAKKVSNKPSTSAPPTTRASGRTSIPTEKKRFSNGKLWAEMGDYDRQEIYREYIELLQDQPDYPDSSGVADANYYNYARSYLVKEGYI